MDEQGQPPFFSLPLELRNQIYLLLLKDERTCGRDFKRSPCPIGTCDQANFHIFQSLIRLSHVNRQMASDVKSVFDLYHSDLLTLPFWDVNRLLAAVSTASSDPSRNGLRNARFTLRLDICSGNIPQAKTRLMADLGVAHQDGGQIVQTFSECNAHYPCECLETAHVGVEWRQTVYSPIRGAIRLYSWRKWYNLPWAMAPSEPRLRKWLVLEGRISDLIESDVTGETGQ